jgi:hypothetical protein
MVTVSPLAAPFALFVVTVPLPCVPFTAVKVSKLEPFLMVIVWPEVGPAPEKVPVAVAPDGKGVRVNVFELLPAEFVRVMVGDVVEVGNADTVPTTEDVVALVVSVNVFAPLVMVTP